MTLQRSASLTVRQGFGIGVLAYGVFQFLVTVFVLIVIFPIQIAVGSIPYDGLPTIVGFAIAGIIMLGFAVLILIVGIYLLRDKNGMYIRFLKN